MIDLDHRINWESFYSRWIKIDKFSGDHAIVLCPFHQDKHPSFNINMKTGQYKCHSCNETGNAYTFLEKHQNMTKEQAKEYLMKEAGIEPNEPLKKKKPRFTVAEYCRAGWMKIWCGHRGLPMGIWFAFPIWMNRVR